MAGGEERARERYRILEDELGEKGISIAEVTRRIRDFEVEVPSWVFGNFGGGRFGGFTYPGAATSSFEKIEDAGLVHRLTGATPRVAIHVGWDKPEDVAFDDVQCDHFEPLADKLEAEGLAMGAVNPTLFLEGTQYGSLSSPIDEVRRSLIRHSVTSGRIAERFAAGLVTYWLPDGSNYPGQIDLWKAEKRIHDAFDRIMDESPDAVRILIEYKLFEPGTYSTHVSDWGAALEIARRFPGRAGVLVDMGHHAFGVNVPQIVARLIGLGVPGGFHFNSRYAADDDHSVEPNREMFAIFNELAAGGVIGSGDPAKDWAYMIDQCSSLENRIEAVLHTVDSLMLSYARALILDRARLAALQAEELTIQANREFLAAMLTDVRPILAVARMEKDLPADPVAAYVASGYQDKINAERRT